jgi:redox-sensitive bicupin YhaK (pirin superfamily)
MDIRRGDERGTTEIDWLTSRHTFSFGDYFDPERIGFRALRVLNDDVVAAGGGFPTHGHRDMEIVSIVLEGALEHRDSLGHGEVLRPGEVQVMSAGSGIRHSEFNPSATQPAHFLQVWIVPERNGLPPAYGQKPFAPEGRRGRLQRVAGPPRAQRDDALRIHQDADVFLHVIAGEVEIDGARLGVADAAAFDAPPDVSRAIVITAPAVGAELLFFDLG